MLQPSLNAMRLLLVEDEPDLVSGLLRSLRKEGYSVDVAMDGEEGLYKALNTDYAVVVLDVMLPLLDGWEVLARLREAKDTPVLMLTARDTTADRVRGLDTGADDYLVKPFDVAELLSRLRAILRRSSGGRVAQTLEVADITIDTRSRTVTCGGETVTLTAREYLLLEYFAQHRGEIITRTDLYEKLFDETDDTLSNVIDVHIFNLRKKLGKDIILTRRGYGYLMP